MPDHENRHPDIEPTDVPMADAEDATRQQAAAEEAGVPGGADAVARERDEYLDLLQRKTAEFDNFRKRVERERRETAEWAAADMLTEVLAVIDDFERALAVEIPAGAEAYRTGVELICKRLQDLVMKRGVTPVAALGSDFDPRVHQAVAYEETPGAREGEVIGELRKGYTLGERLLRPAMVRVAKAAS